MTLVKRWFAIFGLILLVLGCSFGRGNGPAEGSAISQAQELSAESSAAEQGFVYHLSQGGIEDAYKVVAKATGLRPLTDSELSSLLKRFPKFMAQPLETDFALRESSLPPPRTGSNKLSVFPPLPVPSTDTPGVDSKELKLLRYSPQGDVPLAPQLSLTFNQPMVALTSHSELAKLDPIVKLSPQPPGNWRWIGTNTLLFEPRGEVSPDSSQQARFPMATEYQVEVPAGTKSASGAVLAKKENWTFSTPTVAVVSSGPNGGPNELDPLVWAVFNQDIDAVAVFKTVKLVGSDGDPIALRLATPDEAKISVLKQASPKRWLAFKATNHLRPATSYTVTIGPGTPSAEGPLLTKGPQSFSFSTYDKFAVKDYSSSRGDNVRPLSPLWISFNNPIDVEKFTSSMVKISPEIPNLRVNASGSGIQIVGDTKGRTTYTVTLDAKLPDTYGQTLEEPKTLSIKVGSAEASLTAMGELLVTLDPKNQSFFPVYVMNESKLKVLAYSVTPADWSVFQKRLSEEREDKPFISPGQKVIDSTIETKAASDELTEVRIDLKSVFHSGKGMAVVVIEAPKTWSDWWQRRRSRIVKWVQATDIGLDAAVDNKTMQLFSSDLSSGKPYSKVKLNLIDENGAVIEAATSDQDGMAAIELGQKGGSLLVAEHGDDVSILPEQANYYSYGSWRRIERSDQTLWCIVDDRNMYRPGDEVSLKGWMRRWQAGPKGDIVGLKGDKSTVEWTVNDSQGNEILKGKTPVSSDGAFNFDFKLPKTVNLGQTSISLYSSLGGSSSHYFQVQEFRRPEYEVTTSANSDFALIGDAATVTAEAKYYAGGGLPGAIVNWSTLASPGSYAPPGHDDFSFGAWTPWWDIYSWRGYQQEAYSGPSQQFKAVTDSQGAHRLKISFVSVNPPRPMVVKAQATVSDVNRQAWSASSDILVHPSRYYVGLKTNKAFIESGKMLDLELIACDLDGKEISGVPIEVTSWRNSYTYSKGQYKEAKEDLVSQTVSSSLGATKVVLKPKRGGTYTIKARIVDDKGRPNESSTMLWVSGDKEPSARSLEQGRLTLVPSQKEYKAGDTAEILVQSPFAPAEGVLTLRRSGILKSERISLKEATAVVKVPISEDMVPNVTLQIDLNGASKLESGKSAPAFASGSLDLSIPPLQRTLLVNVAPANPSSDPGAKTSLEVAVKDADGKPVAGAEVTLFAVDEAVLALSGYQFPNPLDVFYAKRPTDTADYHSRKYVVLTRLQDLVDGSDNEDFRQYKASSAGGGGRERLMMMEADAPPPPPGAPMPVAQALSRGAIADASASAPQQPATPIRMRTDFNPTALFAPMVETDKAGKASVPFVLPDNLTRYRLVAIATDGAKRFGKGESKLVARLPLMVRPSAPRFLNFGDTFELPVVLQNQTDKDMDVQVATRAVNLKFNGAAGFSLKVPANDRVEVRFPASTVLAGKVNLQVGAVGAEGEADAAEASLPVWTPATTEAFATYGQIDEGAIAQPVKAPQDVFPQFGGLEITTTSTALQSLTDAFIYLTTYPFDCSEQVSSRLLTIAALRDVLWAFKAEGIPSADELKGQVKRDMDRLALIQQSSGGFGFWPGSPENWPFVSVHVGHALARAKEKGYEVPENMLSRLKSYLKNIESYIPSNYPMDSKRVIRAYALYVRNRLGDTDSAKIKALIAEAGGATKLPIEAMGWVYYVVCKDPTYAQEVAQIRKYLNNHVTETAGNAHFVAGYKEDSGYVILASDRRADGILLEAMIKDQPSSDLIPKIARGLLAGRKRGRWSNTQDNCFVMLALDLYFHTYEKITPDFLAKAWLGSEFVGEQQFKGREVDYKSSRVPMSYLADKGEKMLTLAKEGKGRLYYRLAMNYAPKSLKLEPADHGFTVDRRYEGIDDKDDVKKDDNGVWHIKAGSRVRVSLSMVAVARRYHVALVDPLPAGLEVLNPALAVTGSLPPASPSGQRARAPIWDWIGTWYDHQNMRDERVEAFSTLLWEGVYEYSYVARATTPGTFIVPPTKAEEMYAPETFGRSASDKVVVE